jgi:peptide/nickel transport system substrate-binding protein
MAKKLLFCLMAAVMVLGVILVGCGGGGGGPQPVTINMLIRNNDLRLEIGDYVGNQLQTLGFTVTRQYGTSGQLGPIWKGDPRLGLWGVYTGAWISTAVSRDEGSNFGVFYTPLGAQATLWDYYEPTDEFYEVASKLFTNDFSNMSARQALFEQAVPMSMEDSVRVWLDDRASFTPLRQNVATAYDAYGGIEGSFLWAPTIQYRYGNGTPVLPAWDGGTNGTLTVKVALEGLLDDPWNPVMGSNWAFDQFPIRSTCDNGFEYDVRDGLTWPHIASKADVIAQTGLPISQGVNSTGWLNLTTSLGPIAVPTTAWADWDAATQTWINAAANTTAKTKTVVYYPPGTFGRALHDGSTLSAGDFLVYAIMQFDRAKTASTIYDVSYVPQFEAFMDHFKGVTFNFTVPGYDLVVTTYDDLYYMDAELIARGNSWFPTGSTVSGLNLGPWVWHNLALGILAERDSVLEFSQSKADALDTEWLSFIAGPSLAILNNYLTNVTTPANPDYRFLPYRNIVGPYVNNATVDARYQNLKNWYGNYTNFWIGSGPFYLSTLNTLGKTLELNAFQNYPDAGNRWFFMMTPVPVTPPTHNGAWVDKVTCEVETDHTAGVTRVQSNNIQVYAAGLTEPDLLTTVQGDPNLHYYLSAGLFDELTFNPSGPFFPATGKLNPFAIPEIREAMNWAVDRDYIVGEIYGGSAYARYTCVGTQTGDYINRYPALFAATEADYPYDFALANSTIYAAMMAINGTTYTDGKYYYEPPA